MTTCSRCGRNSDLHLVSFLYEKSENGHQRGNGRLLIYCVVCVNELSHALYLNIPLEIVSIQILEYLYKMNYTSSDPETFLKFVLSATDPSFALNDINHKNYLEVASRLAGYNLDAR